MPVVQQSQPINGAHIHFLNQVPTNLENYKESFLFVNNTLNFVNPDESLTTYQVSPQAVLSHNPSNLEAIHLPHEEILQILNPNQPVQEYPIVTRPQPTSYSHIGLLLSDPYCHHGHSRHGHFGHDRHNHGLLGHHHDHNHGLFGDHHDHTTNNVTINIGNNGQVAPEAGSPMGHSVHNHQSPASSEPFSPSMDSDDSCCCADICNTLLNACDNCNCCTYLGECCNVMGKCCDAFAKCLGGCCDVVGSCLKAFA